MNLAAAQLRKWRKSPVAFVREAFGAETYQRLRVLKAKYDAHNRFRFSFNIPEAVNDVTKNSLNKRSSN